MGKEGRNSSGSKSGPCEKAGSRGEQKESVRVVIRVVS